MDCTIKTSQLRELWVKEGTEYPSPPKMEELNIFWDSWYHDTVEVQLWEDDERFGHKRAQEMIQEVV